MCLLVVATLFFPSPTHLTDFFLLFFPFYHFSCKTHTIHPGVKQNFVQCVGCSLVLVYKSRTGTASLLRHRCTRFPISVYDLKQSILASNHADMMNEMATSSSNNGNAIEMKQELLSDEEIDEGSYEEQDEDQQTDKGLLESFSLLEKTFMTGDELLLSREEIEIAKRNNDPDLSFER